MSQSPLNEAEEEAVLSYRQGWRALNRLLHENRSFSGNERHCAFLNCGLDAEGNPLPFADVSSAVGFYFPEDGRGLSFTDWDFDGDLDVWTTCRTAPRVRFLRNNSATGNHFVAFRLEGNGKTTNRDAIGARLTLHLADTPVPIIKTLHAGHNFVSQSSSWVHFGLGTNDKIEKLVINWPAGGPQEVVDLKVDQHYRITQSKPRAVPWSPPAKRALLQASEPELAPPSQSARIIVPPGMLLPQLSVLGVDQQAMPLQRKEKGLFLINLWSASCLPCQEELADWAHEAELFRKAGIEVVALHAAGAGSESYNEGLAKAREVVAKTGFPFRWAPAAPITVKCLDLFHAACLDLWNPLPVPSSFLVDTKGEALAIYVGPVEATQILADAKLAEATPEQRRDASIPFPGRWVDKPAPGDVLRVATQMIDRNEIELAIDYLTKVTAVPAPKDNSPDAKRALGDQLYMLGILLDDQIRLEAARRCLESARRLIPTDVRIQATLQRVLSQLANPAQAVARLTTALKADPSNQSQREELGMLQMRMHRFTEAASQLELVVLADPGRSNARYHLANALLESGQPREAIKHLKQTLTNDPRFLEAANRLAWIIATHPDPAIRSPKEAVLLGSRLCSFSKNQNPRYLDTLATAHAADGSFPKATAAANQALSLYKSNPAFENEANAVAQRLKLFEAGKPFVEERWAKK